MAISILSAGVSGVTHEHHTSVGAKRKSDDLHTAACTQTAISSRIQDEFQRRGVSIIRVPEEIVKSFNIQRFLSEQLEFLEPERTRMKVLGGFGAYGNPSSYHHPDLRTFRHSLWLYIENLLKEIHRGKYLQCIADRFSVRLKDKPVTPESWHRDMSIPYDQLPQGIVLYGGWINLDTDNSQFFSCVPGSHLQSEDGSGFARLSASEAAHYKARKELIEIPPGHCILFNERIVHEVVKTKQTIDESYRLYNKYLISDSPLQIFGQAVFEALENQGILPLHIDSTGKFTYPPMFSKRHATCFQPLLDEFTKKFDPRFVADVLRSKKPAKCVYQFMPSLRSVGIDTFPPYTAEEIDMFRPKLLE
jgi:hypothetical protein